MSIHIASQTWPSGSARLRLYIKPRSFFGLMSAVPPFAKAALFIESTCEAVRNQVGKDRVLLGLSGLLFVRNSARVQAATEDELRLRRESLQRLLDSADQALYRAKGEGRNRVCVSEPDAPLAAETFQFQ